MGLVPSREKFRSRPVTMSLGETIGITGRERTCRRSLARRRDGGPFESGDVA